MAFQVYSVSLDKLFYSIDGVNNKDAISLGMVTYFGFFIGYYGIFVMIIIAFFEVLTFYTPFLRRFGIQLLIATFLGCFIGSVIGDGNISMYRGEHEVLKSIIVYGALGTTLVILKFCFKLNARIRNSGF